MASNKEQWSNDGNAVKCTNFMGAPSSLYGDREINMYASPVKKGYTISRGVLPHAATISCSDLKVSTEIYDRDLSRYYRPLHNVDFTVKPMRHTGVLSRRILSLLEKEYLNTPDQLMEVCLKYRTMYIDSRDRKQEILQISMFAGKLALYFNMFPEKKHVLTPAEYMKYSAEYGPVFADIMKKAKSLATLSTLSELRFIDLDNKIKEFNDEFGEIIRIDQDREYSYDDFLNEDNFFFFMDEDVDDFKWAFEPVEVDESALLTFKDILREILQTWKVKNLMSPPRNVKATWTSDSTSWEKEPSKKTAHRNIVRSRLYEGHSAPFGEHNDQFLFRRSIIPVAPANFRDSWEPSFDTIFSIRSISYVMRQIIQPIPYSAMYDANIAYRRKRKLFNKDALFLMIDFKKSGLTIPRRLITAMAEVLCEVYPENEELRYIFSYESLQVHDGKKFVTPPRGCGLGNMNELYTLMQCVWGHLSYKAYQTRSIFFNDDAAMELHDKYYRRQVILIMSFIKRLGCILNLTKTLISRSTIFCEEYRTTHHLDYRKEQLLVLPMLGAMYTTNTACSKRFFYSINRGLIGTGFRALSLHFLKILDSLYPNEFGNMDIYLPYHLGGWYDFSETNFSCLIEFITDPKYFSSDSRFLGSIPEMRRWIAFQLHPGSNGNNILTSRAVISYRGNSLKNPLHDPEILGECGTLTDYVLGYCGLESIEEHEKSMDSIINNRGLHNAKPKIRIGLDEKWRRQRQAIYRRFKKFCHDRLNLFTRDALSVNRALFALKSIADAPAYFSYPSFMVKKSEGIYYGELTKVIVYKKGIDYSKSITDLRNSVFSTLESLKSDKKWYFGSDPFIFYEFWRRRKSGYLLADRGLPKLLHGTGSVPANFRAFCPNKTLFIRELAFKTGAVPWEYHDGDHRLYSEYQMFMLKDAFENILPPDLIGRWRDIKEIYKDHFYALRNVMGMINLDGRVELEAFLSAAEKLFKLIDPEPSRLVESLDEDIVEVLERFEDETIYTRLIAEVFTVEDLLEGEDFDDDIFIYSDEEVSDIFEDFEEFEGSDAESEDDNLDLNEIRRLHRQEQASFQAFDM